MKFLAKKSSDLDPLAGLSYERNADRKAALKALVRFQLGFCAYSERFLKPLDSTEIEHFDPRLKGTDQDNIENWHAVVRWMNAHKARRIEPFLPLPNPHDPTLAVRIRYERGFFVCNSNDVEATNLIEFLGLNRPELCAERRGQVQRLRRMQSCFADSPGAFTEVLLESPEDLSFPSALEAELGIPAMDLIRRLPTEGLSEANP